MSLNIVNSFKLTPPPPELTGGWVELGRTILGAPGNTIDVTSLADKRYLMVVCNHLLNATNPIPGWRFNGDAASNYAERISVDGGADALRVSQTRMFTDSIGVTASNWFHIQYFSNLATSEKLTQTFMASNRSGVGAGNAPSRVEHVGKWSNSSNAINAYNGFNINTGTFDTDTEIVVLGWDPTDTHTENFWEELASVDLSGGAADNLNSGTFTAKKYLWVQAFMEADGGLITGASTFNGDTAGNYARRRQSNGAADNTAGNETAIDVRGGENKNRYDNMFIVNNLSKEKLVIGNLAVTTAGVATVPDRVEYVAKWANTSSQITSINYSNTDAGSYGTTSIIKVWGSD